MKLLITGASGFIGGRLVEAAIDEFGADSVLAFSSRPNDRCATVVYDSDDFSIRDADLARLEPVEVLIHAGAFTPKSATEANSKAGCSANIAFTEKLLSLPLGKLRKILYLSTLDVYAPAELITESTPTVPATLYGQSKLDCEKFVIQFAEKARIASQILRIGHVYGPGEEKYAKFLPTVIRNIVAGEPVELWGDGSELRSLIYIDDVVAAILNAISLEQDPGTINITSGSAISIRQILDHVIEISGKRVEVVARDGAPGTKRDWLFDDSKCKAHLLPRETDFLTGLRAEYAHVENNLR